MWATAEQRRAVAERRADVVELRQQGLSWREIARRVGLPSGQAAQMDHHRATEAAGAGRPMAEAACGTWAAYRRHRKRGEPVDEACQAAAREQSARRYVPRARPG